MKITKTLHGWNVGYDTEEEKNALNFLLIALYEKYCPPTITTVDGLLDALEKQRGISNEEIISIEDKMAN